MQIISTPQPSIGAQIRLYAIFAVMNALNGILAGFQHMLFRPFRRINVQRILIYKNGNIGDITCAIPSFIAIRRAFPDAHITLLSSPGYNGGIGARELLTGAWYLNRLHTYTLEGMKTWRQKWDLLQSLKQCRPDLFIQLPDDTAHFLALLRNALFASLVGCRSAFGFTLRSIPLFKKTQVDHLVTNTEVESLLDILRHYGIESPTVEYSLPIQSEDERAVDDLLRGQWADEPLLIGISPSCKRETNRWPIERFSELARYLCDRYRARIVVIGGRGDAPLAKHIGQSVPAEYFLDATGRLTLLQSVALIKRCSLLIANSTGTIHLAAAVEVPCLGFYSVRDIFGRWFPYGQKHRVLYHKFFSCNYTDEECIEKSILAITPTEAMRACDEILQKGSPLN